MWNLPTLFVYHIILPYIGSITYQIYVYLYSIFIVEKEPERIYAFCSTCSCPFFLPSLPLKGLPNLFAHFFFAL